MVVVNGTVRTTPEAISALKDAIAVMERASREEEGCIDYTFSVEVSDPAALRITVDVFDRERRLDRPIRHVMTIPVGG